MESFTKNPIVKEDIDIIIKTKSIDWEKFNNKTIAVTGATGLVGRITVMALLMANRQKDLNLTVLAFVRNREKANKIYEELMGRDLKFIVQDITEVVSKQVKADFLIHGASVTTSKLMVESPVETILTAIEGTKSMMQFATRCSMEGVVYLSSMEAYGILDKGIVDIYEKDLGYIDPLNIRSSYSEGKRMSECLCASYASEYQVPVKIARLAQTFGAGIDKNENRVFAQFAKSVLHKQNIILHTKGEKANCYCYTTDAVSGILTLLTRGEAGEAYNVANINTFCSIKEMGETFITVGDNQISKLVFDIPEDIAAFGYAPTTIMKLNSTKMINLGWRPQMTMSDMAERLMKSIAFEENYRGI